MVETPIISTRLACNLVGPINRTKAVYKYILAVMCVGKEKKDGWIDDELSLANTVQWVNELSENLTKLYEQAGKKGVYKEKSKQYCDRKSKDDHFRS